MSSQFHMARCRQVLTLEQVPAFLAFLDAYQFSGDFMEALDWVIGDASDTQPGEEQVPYRRAIRAAVTYLYTEMAQHADFATDTFGVHEEEYMVTGGMSSGDEPTRAYGHIRVLHESRPVFDAFEDSDG